MALIYFYDVTELDKQQITAGLEGTDHNWQYVDQPIAVDNLNPDTEVISVFVTSNVTAEIIDALPKLKLIACRSTGFNNINIAKAKEKAVTVVNVPSYGESTVAEYAFSLILALQRKLPQTIDSFDKEVDSLQLMGNDLCGKTLGVIGTGRIGQHAIKIGKGFEMKVVAYDPFPKPDLDKQLQFDYMSLDELLKQSDVVTIHAPYTGTNKHLLNSSNLKLLKPSSVVVNTARGELVDTQALTQALADKSLAGAALDVIEGEQLMHVDEEVALLRSSPISVDLFENSLELLALHKMPNVILSPHNAFNSLEAVKRINDTTTTNIIDYWYGKVGNAVQLQPKARGKLLIVRHAESEWNATGQWSGITDVHLSETGFKEAAMFGLALRELDVKLDKAFCSEQIRTLETLEAMLDASQQFDVPIARSGAINERDYGDYTGKNKWQMRDLLGEDKFNLIRRGWNQPIPNGESLKMVYDRATPFYLKEVVPLLNQGQNILIVAHGNSIRALMKYIESIDDKQIESLEMIFGDIVTYELDDQGKSLKRDDSVIDIKPPNA